MPRRSCLGTADTQALTTPGAEFLTDAMNHVARRQPKELERVAVAKDGERLGVRLSHRWCDFWRVEDGLLKEGRLELTFEPAAAPSFLYCHPQVEIALFRPLALAQDEEVVAPGQLSHQWRDNSAVAVCLIELLHSKEIQPRRSSKCHAKEGFGALDSSNSSWNLRPPTISFHLMLRDISPYASILSTYASSYNRIA